MERSIQTATERVAINPDKGLADVERQLGAPEAHRSSARSVVGLESESWVCNARVNFIDWSSATETTCVVTVEYPAISVGPTSRRLEHDIVNLRLERRFRGTVFGVTLDDPRLKEIIARHDTWTADLSEQPQRIELSSKNYTTF